MPQFNIGTILDKTYELLKLLGRGGMGEVWQAQHLRLPKRVAIKVLDPVIQNNPEAVARFRREAFIASQLGHPNIVEVLDFNTLPDGVSYLVMELLEGESLRDRLARGALTVDETLIIIKQVASALEVAHQAGVVHRDLKPENIFLVFRPGALSSEPWVKILDFGISKIQGSQTLVTREQALLGTPGYMSPEQAAGKNSEIDSSTDQFALATIVYEMLSGRCPFTGNTLSEVIYKVVFEPTPSLKEVNPAVPFHIAEAVDRSLAKDPRQRFPDVATFFNSLMTPVGQAVDGAALAETHVSVAPVAAASVEATPMLDKSDTTSAVAEIPSEVAPLSKLQSSKLQSSNSAPPMDAAPEGHSGNDRAGANKPRSLLIIAIAVGIGLIMGVVLPRWLGHHNDADEKKEHYSTGKNSIDKNSIGKNSITPSLNTSSLEQPSHRPAIREADAAHSTHLAMSPPHLPPTNITPDSRAISSPPKNQPKPLPLATLPPRGALLPAVRSALEEAQRKLDTGDYPGALHLARRTLAQQTTPQAYAIMAQAYCGYRDLGNAKAMLRNVNPALRAIVHRFCRRVGLVL